MGHNALGSNTTGVDNAAFGSGALLANTTAANNSAFGAGALDANTTGEHNTAVGREALGANTTGSNSAAVGRNALFSCTTGNHNTAIGGAAALYALTTGTHNTACGTDALQSTTTGNDNVAVGSNAGSGITSGSENVCLGHDAGATQIGGSSDRLYIARRDAAASNTSVWIHGDQHGRCYMGSNDSSWHTTSDQRLKKDIVDNTTGLEIINQVRVRNFKYKQYSDGSPVSSDDTVDISEFPDADSLNQVLIQQGETGVQLGCIAQELETVLPNAVKTGDKGVKTVVTDELFWHMLNAIKELSAKVTALEGN